MEWEADRQSNTMDFGLVGRDSSQYKCMALAAQEILAIPVSEVD